MPSYWIWPITGGNFEVLKSRGYDIADFKRETRNVRDARPGDLIAVCVLKIVTISAILQARSAVHRRTDRPIWADETSAAEVKYPYRIDCELATLGQVDFRPLYRQMQKPSDKQKSFPQAMGAFLRGGTLLRISQADFTLLERSLKAGGESISSPPAPPVQAPPQPTQRGRRAFGAPLNFRELRHEPINEQGVVFLFGMVARELDFLVDAVGTGFPDCRAKRLNKKGYYEEVDIEFEFLSRNFRDQGHDPEKCDLIVCWEHNWADCPIEVLELKTAIRQLKANV